MSEVLARARHDSVLSGASIGALQSAALRGLRGLQKLRRALPTRVHAYAVIALALAMTLIVVNALTLQREHHPAPFFVESAPLPAPAAKLLPERAAPLAPVESIAPPRAVARSSESGSRPEQSSNSRPIDPIADMLHNEANKEAQRLWTNAQTALIKLGYSVKIGEPGNAEAVAALHDFEKAHGFPVSNEVTPRLVKLLGAAVNSSAAR